MSMMLKNKKAQITVFMIIGIILLFSSAIAIYIKNQVAGVSEEFVAEAEQVPLEAQPIKLFVEDCMKKVGSEAVVQLGIHGGYIDPRDIQLSGGKTFMIGISPTESDALSVFESDKAIMPYWWYLQSANDCSGNCRLDSHRPSLKKGTEPSIEGQVDKYIEAHIKRCLNDFEQFKIQGFDISENGEIKSDTKVTENEVVFFLTYPITVTLEGRKTEVSNFFTKIDVDLKDIYELATDLLSLETDDFFLETHTMNLIAMYSTPTSEDKIPPLADASIGIGDYKIWTRTETQSKIERNVLTVGIPMLQVKGTKNYIIRQMVTKNSEGEYVFDAVGQGLVEKTTIVLENASRYSELGVDFTYLDWWPTYLNINDQEVLTPSSVQGSSFLSFIGINDYSFWYDISFPVMVTIRDYDALNRKGYTFRFPIEVNIRDNNHTAPTYVNFAVDAGNKISCDASQRNSDEISIETKDAITGLPVTARVDFILGEQACLIGMTKLNSENKTVISAPFPIGWGILRINNESYLLNEQRFVTRSGKGENITVSLMPYRFINATVFTRGLSYDNMKGRYVLPQAAAPSPIVSTPDKSEKAFLMFKRQSDEMLSEFSTYLTISTSTNNQLMKLVPGNYEVRGFVLYESNISPIRVPKEHFEYSAMFGLKEVPVDFNETIMDQYQTGGIALDEETGFLNIDKEKLLNSNKIVFYVLRFPPPTTHSETMKNAPGLDQVGKVKEYSGVYRHELEPEWI